MSHREIAQSARSPAPAQRPMQIPKSGRQAMAAVHDTRMQLLLVPQDLGQARLYRWVLRDSFDLLGLES